MSRSSSVLVILLICWLHLVSSSNLKRLVLSCHSRVLLKTVRVSFLSFQFIELQIDVLSHLKLITSLPLEKKNTFRKLVCGLLQFVPRTAAHQQYTSKELAHSYKCVFKLKMYSALMLALCGDYGRKYFYQTASSTWAPGKLLPPLDFFAGEQPQRGAGAASTRGLKFPAESLPWW